MLGPSLLFQKKYNSALNFFTLVLNKFLCIISKTFVYNTQMYCTHTKYTNWNTQCIPVCVFCMCTIHKTYAFFCVKLIDLKDTTLL